MMSNLLSDETTPVVRAAVDVDGNYLPMRESTFWDNGQRGEEGCFNSLVPLTKFETIQLLVVGSR